MRIAYLRCECQEERHEYVTPAQKDDIFVVFQLARQCVQGEN